MAIRLNKLDQEFRNPLLFCGDAKTIDLNRVLLNLFMLIKYDGVRPRVRAGRKEITIESVLKQLLDREAEGLIKGFSENKEGAQGWIISNLVDLVNRGNLEKEAIASLRAIHLNSFKYRNPKHSRDYLVSEQVYTMLKESPFDLIKELKLFLLDGFDTISQRVKKDSSIDLDTLGILRVIEKLNDDASGENQFKPFKCLCPGQARIFCDDIRRILVYKDTIPRHVILEYFKTLIGLHVTLYLFKLFKLLPEWVKNGERNTICKNCTVDPNSTNPFKDCPYKVDFVVDCCDNPDSIIAKLAERDTKYFYTRIHDYVKATFAINMSLQFLQKNPAQTIQDLDNALYEIKHKSEAFNQYFKFRKQNLFSNFQNLTDEDKEGLSIYENIINLNLSEFDTFIEIIMKNRSAFQFKYHKQLIDTLLQKNKETGLIWAGRGRKHGRRFFLASRLLETLVQLSVLKVNTSKSNNFFYSEPIIIESFLENLYERYGFIINGIDNAKLKNEGIYIHNAFKDNVNGLKSKLREIGFFNVLSDAYLMQRIHPRYSINQNEG